MRLKLLSLATAAFGLALLAAPGAGSAMSLPAGNLAAQVTFAAEKVTYYGYRRHYGYRRYYRPYYRHRYHRRHYYRPYYRGYRYYRPHYYRRHHYRRYYRHHGYRRW